MAATITMVPSRRGGARIPAPALVGRAAELACLLDRLEAARGSQGSVVLLVGEAGVGKSRLCQELIGRASESTACLYGAGSPCLPETELGPFVDALRGHLRELTPAAARELLGPDAYGMSRLLPELADLSPAGSSAPISSPDRRRYDLEACLRAVRRLAQRRPLLLVLEDLQWADRGTLELVRYLAAGLHGRPVLLICTYRGDEANAPSAGGTHTARLPDLSLELLRARLADRLDLQPLDRRATAELVGAFFDLERPVSGDFAAAIHRYASGNPFFTEETVKALIESGGIFHEDGTVLRRDLTELTLPPTVRDLVIARLDRLAPEARRVLEALAVAGRRCELGVIARASRLNTEAAASALGEAYRRGFLARDQSGGYGVRHDLVRRALLEPLVRDEQRVLHARLGAAIEAEYAAGDGLAGWHAELAQHYWRAAEPTKAAEHAWPAAIQALSVHAYSEAIPLLRICLAADPAGACRAAILERLGDAYVSVGVLAEAVAAYETLLADARAQGDDVSTGRALRKLAEVAHDKAIQP